MIWKARFSLAILVLALVVAGPVSSQADARRISRLPLPEAVRAADGFDPAQSVGLFVGIRHFDDKRLEDVPYAVDDAVDLAHLLVLDLELIAPGRAILALEGEPWKSETRQRLQALLAAGVSRQAAGYTAIHRQLEEQRALAGPKGLFVVFMATHGFSSGGNDVLVASDSRRRRIARTSIDVDLVFEEVAEAASPRGIVLLDACRENLSLDFTRGVSTKMSQSFADAIAQASGLVVLSGSTSGGFAYDDSERQNGVFTSAILEGLRGGADSDDRSLITVGTLAEYVNREVLDWVRQNRPEHLEISRGIDRRIEGDGARIPLALDADRLQSAENAKHRRDSALAILRQNIGGPITGAMYDSIDRYLSSDRPQTEQARLIEEIEALDGSLRMQRSLAHYFEELESRISHRPMPQPPTVLPSPPSRRPHQAGELWEESGIGMRFRFVPAGSSGLALPPHGYWLGETEVSQGEWKQLMGNNPSHFTGCGDDCPVESVNWYEALSFANALSQKTGLESCYTLSECLNAPGEGMQCGRVNFRGFECRGYRLPTEEEWRRATLSGGSKSGMAEDELKRSAWYGKNSFAAYDGAAQCPVRRGSSCGTHPVRRKQANEWHFYDLIGNVSEWTWTAVTETVRVRRGCSWYSTRCTHDTDRDQEPASNPSHHIGFRLARTMTDQN